jgi:general secretion pathway protein F
MPNFRYRALTQSGEIVNGSLAAANALEVAQRIEFLGLFPIETAVEDGAGGGGGQFSLASFNAPREQDVTIFTRDLALLLKAGARLDDGLELLAGDKDIGKLRSVVGKIRAAVLSGESFAEAIGHHPTLFSPLYIALVQVGETSGKLTQILEVLGAERARNEATRRKLTDSLNYPAFILLAASAVLIFFMLVVLPQFSTVLRDFNAKPDAIVSTLLDLSDLIRGHLIEFAIGITVVVVGGWAVFRRPDVRGAIMNEISKVPGISTVFNLYRTGLFCRNLSIMLGSDVTLSATLRILVDIMAVTGRSEPWIATSDRVRHGGKLSEALAATAILPSMAIRMLRIGEETGQLAVLAGRVADFYEAKLQRSLDRIVAIIGPVAIITISIVVGGLIVSVMTALLSINQVVG